MVIYARNQGTAVKSVASVRLNLRFIRASRQSSCSPLCNSCSSICSGQNCVDHTQHLTTYIHFFSSIYKTLLLPAGTPGWPTIDHLVILVVRIAGVRVVHLPNERVHARHERVKVAQAVVVLHAASDTSQRHRRVVEDDADVAGLVDLGLGLVALVLPRLARQDLHLHVCGEW